MKAPYFWNRRGLFYFLLLPVSWIYAWAAKWIYRSGAKKRKKAPIPVICIGNVTSGGAGKTPFALFVADYFKTRGIPPAFLTRGYGGTLSGVWAAPSVHSAKDVGDEALLLSKTAPTFVSPDRVLGAVAAKERGAKIAIMDDGFQDPEIFKDLSFLVFDGAKGIQNGAVLPAGPLREKLRQGVRRADACLIVGEDKADLKNLLKGKRDIPILHAKTVPDRDVLAGLLGRKILAFAGIGYPDKFFSMLSSQGLDVAWTRAFPDHHSFREKDVVSLQKKAEELGAVLVTTVKDFVRLPSFMKEETVAVPIEYEIIEKELLDSLLFPFLAEGNS